MLLYIVIGIIGLIMFIIGVRFFLQSRRCKQVIQFKALENRKGFQIEKVGLYSISIIGGGYADASQGFNISVSKNESQKKIVLKENLLKYRKRKKWRLSIEFYQFEVTEKGLYFIEIRNLEKLIVKPSMLVSQRMFQKKVNIDNIEISVDESIKPIKRLLAIILTVLGLNIAGFGLITGPIIFK